MSLLGWHGKGKAYSRYRQVVTRPKRVCEGCQETAEQSILQFSQRLNARMEPDRKGRMRMPAQSGQQPSNPVRLGLFCKHLRPSSSF